ncbi:MAG: FliM/FliN family flagellar motor switch protein [Buchnera aphidicola (Brevicoryne brassicae)]|uniref:Flagellar motor switch protein FliM n=1 Tax=Buchnera aphidicola (Brevicoryne brassicae) TaxID=911343 RepID=A0AAJ5PUP1_9GAMM|nr:FliM/FliN family flagellar motor switch protein [Buchnera aphidicola]QCI19662.1 flagellar motor switch protein FliM [Buchnera aphidicola (Brevicoryne brassicae)]WAI19031.1 MAG: FliM/FliN family flagellar motor switch protein [Buchnera aphidicola (Brevicoryne brassicae)]
MGKSNNLHNKFKKIYQRENNLNNFLKEDEIEILENINQYFSKKIIVDFSNFVKKNVKIFSYSMKIESLSNYNRTNISFFNSIEVLPFKNQFFLTFSSNFLSVIIDLLFGGHGDLTENFDRHNAITSTELLINKKITNWIISSFSNVFKKFFSLDIKFINVKIFLDLKKPCFNSNEMFLINCFNFYIDDIEVYFSFLIPLSIIKKINEKKIISTNNDQNLCLKNNVINNIVFEDIYNVELEIIFKINNISIPHDKIYNLSVGDVFLINKPDKIIGFLENQPIFFGKYKRFNEQSIIFIEEFINNLESKKDKEYFDE